MSRPGRLAGKVGVITGAAGGIGSAAARAFVAQGATVGLLDRAGPQLDLLAAELGAGALSLPADLADPASIDAALGAWAAAHDRADFGYLCAGIQLHGSDGPIGDVGLDTWDATIAVNLTGAFLVVRGLLPLLVRAPSGSLIICGSPTALTFECAGYAAYSASKAGMMALTRSVAVDYAEQGVRANTIIPGPTLTPLISSLVADQEARQRLAARVPAGRIGTPEDLVGIAVFLAGDESRYATGGEFAVDGGMTKR